MSSVIHGGDIFRYREELTDFSSNINPLGLPGSLQKVLRGGGEHLCRYPDAEYLALREAIAAYHGITAEQVMVGNGAAEIIYLLGQFFHGRKILIVEPTFGEYREAVTLGGGHVETVFAHEADGWRWPLDEIAAKLGDVDGIWLGHPNNPTGQLMDRAALRQLLEQTRALQRFMILDEAFIDFVSDTDASAVPLLGDYPQLFVIRAFTKWYALPGLRLGYGLGNPDWVRELRRRQIPWSVNSFAVEAGVTVLRDTEYRHRSRQWIEAERTFLVRALAEIPGLAVYPTAANFILCKTTDADWPVARLKAALVERGILIRDASSFAGLDGMYFRVAVKNRPENQSLARAVRDCLHPGRE